MEAHVGPEETDDVGGFLRFWFIDDRLDGLWIADGFRIYWSEGLVGFGSVPMAIA